MPKGRPRSYETDDILDAAVRLFRRDGYGSVGVAALCRETGLATQSLYNQFGDKAGLYRATLRRYGETANGPQIDALNDADDPLAALRAFVDGWKRHAGATHEDGCLFTQAFSLADPSDEDGPSGIAAEFTRDLRAALAGAVRKAVDFGQLAPETQAAELADGLLTLAFGTAVIGRGGLPPAMITNACRTAHDRLTAAEA